MVDVAPQQLWRRLPHPVRWLLAAGTGTILIIVGIALLVLPGPGFVLIALGLAVLASEFAWARTLLHRARSSGGTLRRSITERRSGPGADS